MQSVVGSLRVNLGLDSAQFSKGLANAQASLRSAGEAMQRVGRTLSLSVTAPLAGFAGLTVKVAGDFEASMNRVKAASGATEADLKSLREAAREMGATTQFSASESADAIEVLAKNGLAASDILGGALSASLTLAAASGADLASAGDIATDVMLQFKKEASELATVVDGISGTLVTSKFGIDDYRLALAQAGGVAGGLGVEFDDFNAAIAATSSRFASGSDAGTAFKTFLQRLVPQSDGAKAAMDDLGLSFFDAQGNLDSMAEIAETLRTGLSGLSEEARSEALTKIFGTDALRTAIGLMDAGADGIDRVSDAIDRVSAQDQAAARMEGFNGAVRQLQSAFQELQLAIADSGLLDLITDMVSRLTGVVKSIGEADPKILKLGVVFGGVAAALGPVLIAVGLATTAIAAISAPVLLAVGAVTALTAAAVAFSPELIAVKDSIVGFSVGVKQAFEDTAALIADVFSELPATMAQIGRDIMDGLLAGLRSRYDGVTSSITGFFSGFISSSKDSVESNSPSKVFMRLGEDIMDGLNIGLETTATTVFATMSDITSRLSGDIKGLFRSVLVQGQSFSDALSRTLSGIGSNLRSSLFDSIVSGGGSAGSRGGSGGLLGGINPIGSLLNFGSGGGGILGSLGGIGQGLSGVLSGGGIGSSFANLGGLLSGSTAGLGALGAAIPAIGIVALGIRGLIGSTKELDNGLRVVADSAGSTVQAFQLVERRRFFGLSRSQRTRVSGVSSDVSDPISSSISAFQGQVIDLAAAIGVGTEAFAGFTYGFQISLKGLSEDQRAAAVQAELDSLGEAFVNMVPVVAELRRAGESSIATLARVAQSLSGANLARSSINLDPFGVSEAGARVASFFVDLFGGLEGLGSVASGYFQNFFSESERLERATNDVAQAFSALGLGALPQTTQEFRALVEAVSAAGMVEATAELLKLSGAFFEVTEASRLSAQAALDLAEDVERARRAAFDSEVAGAQFASLQDEVFTRSAGAPDLSISMLQSNGATQSLLREVIDAIREGDLNNALISNKLLMVQQRSQLAGGS